MEIRGISVRNRKDYRAPLFQVSYSELTFYLHPTKTRVIHKMQLEQSAPGEFNTHLVLDGEQLELVRIELNGRPLVSQIDYEQTEHQLTVFNPPETFQLTVETLINPSANTELEGLYLAKGVYCTQCEAEGFRKITYALDRPDVLAMYRTIIYAPERTETEKTLNQYPYLLSNGNLIQKGTDEQGRAWVEWHDPHPKPSYLFALVAGDFDVLKDTYKTQNQKEIQLIFYVEKGEGNKALFALDSLKKAMLWDEETFGLCYDLDTYMVVAVDFFNMGAMENKGLNIFNSKYVLADPSTATDQDYVNIEAVIGHEYFHNWTGNRVTCRDWFQLSLKEGLTVFREQSFSADQGMRAVKRIEDVKLLREQQFVEDASPMAHPIRPEQVAEMNNFYTVTIYNKGAEVVRMLHTLVGEEGFKKGLQHYLQLYDGQAVTCEDFMSAMEAANHRELNQFRRWYAQAGTPELRIQTQYKRYGGRYLVTIEQLSDKPSNAPFHIPLKVEFLTAQGEAIHPEELPPNSLLEITEPVQSFTFHGLKQRPIFAPLADFSAPIRLTYEQDFEDLLCIAEFARDPFLRWDAVQQLYIQVCVRAIKLEKPVMLPEQLVLALKSLLTQAAGELSEVALMLQVPSEETLSQYFEKTPVDAVTKALDELKERLSEKLFTELLECWKNLWNKCNNKEKLSERSSLAIAERMLLNTCLNLLAFNHSNAEVKEAIFQQFNVQNNMTLSYGALQAAVLSAHPIANSMLHDFAEQWSQVPLVMDKWFSIQARTPTKDCIDIVQALVQHPAYQAHNPNRIFALWGSFSRNFRALHLADGAGYIALISTIKKLNHSNPQVASRLLTPLLQWERLPEPQQSRLHVLLLNLRQFEGLAPDLIEKIDRSV